MEQLNNQYGIEGHLSFAIGNGGLTKAVIKNELAEAEVYLQGGHLTHFQPKGIPPVIWMSSSAFFGEGKAIRGGVPICWPWFGPHASNSELPQHGFARTSEWTVVASNALPDRVTSLSLGLSGDGSNKMWPHSFDLVLEFIVGRQLKLILTATNTGSKALELGAAFHTYFNVGDSSKIAISGLGGRDYLDKPDNYARKHQEGDIAIAEEVDRVYLDTADECIIRDSVLNRKIRVSKQGSLSTIVWNPWVEKAKSMADFDDEGYKTMVCIESANAADDVRVLEPGHKHQIVQCVDVE